VKKEIPLTFVHQGRQIDACTLDVSDHGLCVKLSGGPSLPVGDTVDVSLNEAHLKAQVVWSGSEGETPSVLNGLKLLDGTLESF